MQGVECRVLGIGFRVEGLGFRVLGTFSAVWTERFGPVSPCAR